MNLTKYRYIAFAVTLSAAIGFTSEAQQKLSLDDAVTLAKNENPELKATALGIQGTVENLDDGSVSIIASGTREQLQQLVQWCHQGPSKAKVAQVTVTEIPVQAFNGFRILR